MTTKLTREQLDEPNTCDHCDGSSPADCGWCAGVTFTPALPKHEPAAKQPSLTREQLDELELKSREFFLSKDDTGALIAMARRALELEERITSTADAVLNLTQCLRGLRVWFEEHIEVTDSPGTLGNLKANLAYIESNLKQHGAK